MSSFRDQVKEDFISTCEDVIDYFGKLVNVKIFESLNDPGIANSGSSLMYFVGDASDFEGITRNQKFTFETVSYTIGNFRTNIYGQITVSFSKGTK